VVRHNGITIDFKVRTISHLGRTRKFTKHEAFDKVSYFILAGYASLEMAFWRFYGDDLDGGPDEGPHVFNVLLAQYQSRFLDELRLEWRSFKIAGVSFYEIVSKRQPICSYRFSHMGATHPAGKAINSRRISNV
jgi:hypothetical protein